MRGKIDLTGHKLAGLYRVPARRSKHRRKRMPKMPGGTKGAYFILWRIVEGAVRDAFERHPDYLSAKGQDGAQLSVTKRVVGALMGYGAQVPRTESATECRSVRIEAAWLDEADALPTFLAADADAAAEPDAQSIGLRVQAKAWLGAFAGAALHTLRLWRGVTIPARNSTGLP